jgi:hypothetical protein
VQATCPIPRLNLRLELHPSWNDIYNTFPTGTTPDTTKILGVICGVKARGAYTYEEKSKGVQYHPRGIQGLRELTPPVQGPGES